tara:strand:+ start:3607 stop:4572 length:966 start_codon:yes stop_codon:yes gene_type:complete
MNKKLIIFGPWCGEFCYELSWWIPEIRKRRNEDFKDYDAFAVGFDGRKILYKDFTDKYFAYPNDLEDTLKYPATCGEHINGKDIIPNNLKEYVNFIGQPYLDQYDEILLYQPNRNNFTPRVTMAENPYGEYYHYNASDEVTSLVKNKINFNNDRETVAIMARIRYRQGNVCKLDWNPDHWKMFIDMLTNQLKVNVVMIGIPRKDGSSSGGSLIFENSDYVKSIIFSGPDSVEQQIALLQQTKCSVYGASGTAVFPFFIKNAASFTQQTIEEGFRLKFQWERNLTNNLELIEVFDAYKNWDLYNAPAEELYNKFKNFYKRLF